MDELERLAPEAFQSSDRIPLTLLLDDIRSANNVGSIFRTADCFALQHLYLCGITATPPHRDILKTALGSTETVSWSYHPDAEALVQELRGAGAQVQGLEQTEQSTALSAFIPPANQMLVLVVGNEVNGVSQSVLEHCAGTLEIEQFGTKHSLNVAVATGMAVYQLSARLRGKAGWQAG
ncbi:RNA methyltransferase [Lewinella lacunae]|uniref:RNA methyltransferase n=2 Tax=Neolewinella lacunae TaxID=1517758 RepID=A0A923PSR6_9BACT|nr:RNA methyltransferase [Neolewinella lacunae]